MNSSLWLRSRGSNKVSSAAGEVVQTYLAHADLAHELVLVAVHAGQLPHVCEDVLQPVCQLEGVTIAQAELHTTLLC